MASINSWHLQVDVYDDDYEYKSTISTEVGEPWPDGTGTKKQWEEYWKNKYNPKYMKDTNCEFFEPYRTVTLPAPMEHQPTWDMIHVEFFIEKRMEALEKIADMESPILHKWHTWYVWDTDEAPSGGYFDNDPLDEFLGYKLYQPKINSWNRVWPSDKNLYNYFLLKEKWKDMDCVTNPLVRGFEPEEWHDDYLEEDEPWYSDLPGYGTSQGVYLSDGEYAHGGPELVWRNLSDDG